MDKRTDVQIFEVVFKPIPYGLDDNALYTPIQAGAESSIVDICELKDNTGLNISKYNWFFCEESATYWIWKNMPRYKYIGQCQYRRRLQFDEDTDFDIIFRDYDIILPSVFTCKGSLERFYRNAHIYSDILMMKRIIKSDFPEYEDAYDKYIVNNENLVYSAGYVMRYEDFDDWCNFYFSIMNTYKKILDFETEDDYKKILSRNNYIPKGVDYQVHAGGFLAERLFTLWAFNRFDKDRIKYMNYKLMEKGQSM